MFSNKINLHLRFFKQENQLNENDLIGIQKTAQQKGKRPDLQLTIQKGGQSKNLPKGLLHKTSETNAYFHQIRTCHNERYHDITNAETLAAKTQFITSIRYLSL